MAIKVLRNPLKLLQILKKTSFGWATGFRQLPCWLRHRPESQPNLSLVERAHACFRVAPRDSCQSVPHQKRYLDPSWNFNLRQGRLLLWGKQCFGPVCLTTNVPKRFQSSSAAMPMTKKAGLPGKRPPKGPRTKQPSRANQPLQYDDTVLYFCQLRALYFRRGFCLDGTLDFCG